MHTGLLLTTLIIAGLMRWTYLRLVYPRRLQQSWSQRWHQALAAFVIPPLSLIMVAIAIVMMGRRGSMWGLPVGYLGSLLSLGIIGFAAATLIDLVWRERQLQRSLTRLPQTVVADSYFACRAEIDTVFAGYVGAWNPVLILSQPLLDTLNPSELDAVLAHETAHLNYKDNLFFFYLGWLRRLMPWLLGTTILWEELLLLREIRADRYAAQLIDSLTVAEALLTVVQSTLRSPQPTSNASLPLQASPMVAFTAATESSANFTERIETLLSHPSPPPANPAQLIVSIGLWIGLGLPFLSIAFHHL